MFTCSILFNLKGFSKIKSMRSKYDLIVVGAGSGGLGVSLFMAKIGLKTLLVDKADDHIGGDCLNYGCVPSKALIHVARILHKANEGRKFGLEISGAIDINKVTQYISGKQTIIRKHENAEYLRGEGMDVVLGSASFHSARSILVNGEIYNGKKIILAAGSQPAALNVPGIEDVQQYNNESIFDITNLPKKVLVIGGGPIGIEIGQALKRLGSEVTIVHNNKHILPHDSKEITNVLLDRLRREGIKFIMEAQVERFTRNEAIIKNQQNETSHESFDAVFVAIGRAYQLDELHLQNAGIEVKDNQIVVNKYLQTSNKNVFVCGDIAGSLKFSHAAEQHARLILNNLFSPFKKKLDNSHMSWVTFSDPQAATFGLSERELTNKAIPFEKLCLDFKDDDRAVVDDYQYGKLILFISKKGILKKEKILGGSMIAPDAGELIQELILANATSLSINSLFSKIYPYPVASRVNQMIIVKHKEKQLTERIQKLLRFIFRIFN